MAETVRGRNRIAPPVTCRFTSRVICLPYQGLVTRLEYRAIEYRRSSPRFTIVFWGVLTSRPYFFLSFSFRLLSLFEAFTASISTFHFHFVEVTVLSRHSYTRVIIFEVCTGHRGAILFLFRKVNFCSTNARDALSTVRERVSLVGFRESFGEDYTRRRNDFRGEERRLLASCEELPPPGRGRREAEEAEQRADISAAGSC